MSTTRIYSEVQFKNALNSYVENLVSKISYCPVCLSSDLTTKVNKNKHLLKEYKCLDCNSLFRRELSLKKEDIRALKINQIINE